jgi:hypothetical protein
MMSDSFKLDMINDHKEKHNKQELLILNQELSYIQEVNIPPESLDHIKFRLEQIKGKLKRRR